MEDKLPPPYNVAVGEGTSGNHNTEVEPNCTTGKQRFQACITKTGNILKATSQKLTIAFDTVLLVKL